MWCLFVDSRFDYEIKGVLLGIFDDEKKAINEKNKIMASASDETLDEMEYYISKVELNKLVNGSEYYI